VVERRRSRLRTDLRAEAKQRRRANRGRRLGARARIRSGLRRIQCHGARCARPLGRAPLPCMVRSPRAPDVPRCICTRAKGHPKLMTAEATSTYETSPSVTTIAPLPNTTRRSDCFPTIFLHSTATASPSTERGMRPVATPTSRRQRRSAPTSRNLLGFCELPTGGWRTVLVRLPNARRRHRQLQQTIDDRFLALHDISRQSSNSVANGAKRTWIERERHPTTTRMWPEAAVEVRPQHVCS